MPGRKRILITDSELEVLKLICKGYNINEIAEELFLERSTIATHLRNMRSNFFANSTAHLAALAVTYGIVELPKDKIITNLILKQKERDRKIKEKENAKSR